MIILDKTIYDKSNVDVIIQELQIKQWSTNLKWFSFWEGQGREKAPNVNLFKKPIPSFIFLQDIFLGKNAYDLTPPSERQ